MLSPSLICLRFVKENHLPHKVILCVLLASVGVCLELSESALLAEIRRGLEDMEEEDPGIFGDQVAVTQVFGLQSMVYFGRSALGPIAGGLVAAECGWKVMTLGLGVLSLVNSVPMLWLSGPVLSPQAESVSEDEEQPLLSS